MNDFMKGYFEDYTKYYTMINGVPTSPFGTTLAKRCEWCYSVMVATECMGGKNLDKQERLDIKDKMETKQYDIMNKKFCSIDCKEEYTDWNFINKLKKEKEESRRKWKEEHPVGVKSQNGLGLNKEKRKKYLKEYDADRKEQRRDSVNKGMVKYRARKKLLANMK